MERMKVCGKYDLSQKPAKGRPDVASPSGQLPLAKHERLRKVLTSHF